MVKVISLSEDAYHALKSIKGVSDSFSDVVLKLTKKKADLISLFGCARGDTEFIRGLKNAYRQRDKQRLRVY